MSEFKMKRCEQFVSLATSALLTVSLAMPATAMDVAELDDDLTELSLDALLDIEVTSVSKKAEKLSGAAAAAFVITGEELQRLGVRNFAEALRLVPGVHVARVNNGSYAIAARGFNGTTSDKLEVLRDGRSVYTPLFSGVFWDAQDYPMEDVERIEVIRGPGGTLWGSNAVNGVINIVTKRAEDSEQATTGSAGGGNIHGKFATVRSARQLDENRHIRAYAKGFERDPSETRDGRDANDSHEFAQAGFRMDWNRSDTEVITLQGDIYNGNLGGTGLRTQQKVESDNDGANLIARYSVNHSDDASSQAQLFYDRTDRETPETFKELRETFDFSYQLSFSPVENHDVVAGFGYRVSEDETGTQPEYAVFFVPQDRTLETSYVFAQDQFQTDENTTWTIGSKFEHNDFTDFEVQPSIRVSRKLDEARTVWAAVSRAVGTPNRLEEDIAVVFPFDFPPGCGPTALPPPLGPGPCQFTANVPSRIGNPDLESEEVIAIEAGYRRVLSESTSIDIAIYQNNYDNLLTLEGGRFDNKMEGVGRGVELTSIWKPDDTTRVTTGVTWMDLDLTIDSDSRASTAEDAEGDNPEWMAFSRLAFTPSEGVTIDAALRYTDELPNQQVSAYTELDIGVRWRLGPNTDLQLAGQNLLSPDHVEFSGDETNPILVEREYRAAIEMRF